MTNNIVTIKPLDIEKWHGKKGADSFSQPKKYCPLYSDEIGGYDTNLNDDDLKRLSNLIPNRDLSNIYDPSKPHPFWGSSEVVVKLPNHAVTFDTSKPLDFIKVAYLKSPRFKYVANSVKDWEQGLYPEATHVIYDEEEEIEKKSKVYSNKSDAWTLVASLTMEEKRNIAQIVYNKPVRKASENTLMTIIGEAIESDIERFLSYARMNKAELHLRALINEASFRGVIIKKNSNLYFMDELIGVNIDDAVKFLSDKQNQSIKATIIAKIEEK